MKWKYYPLPDEDTVAKKHIFDSFAMGASNHALSKRLTEHCANAKGRMFAIAMESLDIDTVTDYQWAGTYSRGRQWHEAANTYKLDVGDRPIDGLVDFVQRYLRESTRTVVLCENWMFARSDLETWTTRESRALLFGEDVYHIADYQDANNTDLLEATVLEPDRQWLIGVCSKCEHVPEIEITSEALFDEIVANLAHVFVSAFDGEGYLVWSPVFVDQT
jgi:hypothetical protein